MYEERRSTIDSALALPEHAWLGIRALRDGIACSGLGDKDGEEKEARDGNEADELSAESILTPAHHSADTSTRRKWFAAIAQDFDRHRALGRERR